MLARVEALQRLAGMHLGRRAENDRIESWLVERLGQFGGGMADAVFGGDRLGRLKPAADQRDHFDPVDLGQAVQMFLAESAGAGERDTKRHNMSPDRISAA